MVGDRRLLRKLFQLAWKFWLVGWGSRLLDWKRPFNEKKVLRHFREQII